MQKILVKISKFGARVEVEAMLFTGNADLNDRNGHDRVDDGQMNGVVGEG